MSLFHHANNLAPLSKTDEGLRIKQPCVWKPTCVFVAGITACRFAQNEATPGFFALAGEARRP